jgi:hypothetical protein
MFAMLSKEQVLEWARGYVNACEVPDPTLGKDELSPYIMGLMPGSESLSAEDAWQVILTVLSLRPSDDVIGVLAAGPLEDLIDDHGADFIGRIEEEARKSPAFRHLLGGVWRSGTPEVWARVEKARVGIGW